MRSLRYQFSIPNYLKVRAADRLVMVKMAAAPKNDEPRPQEKTP